MRTVEKTPSAMFSLCVYVCGGRYSEHEVKLQRGNCSLSWFSFNDRCYKYVSTPMTWADAELNCLSERANLVSIHSLEEQNFVKTLIKTFDPAEKQTWIRLSDIHKEGTWMCLVSILMEEQNFVKSLIKNFDHGRGPTWIGPE
ncbi:lactose-binding lectin l-2-like protein [Lates japonicus]|uniref:Lactose-binding lectin l-2-like protein n=1 Tax=Lates japonicus TaxID=270547 RepID=A0AAD3NGT9_LATJO|nr:lactose-binding lectin l-2-like protein [Lates japonicus]